MSGWNPAWNPVLKDRGGTRELSKKLGIPYQEGVDMVVWGCPEELVARVAAMFCARGAGATRFAFHPTSRRWKVLDEWERSDLLVLPAVGIVQRSCEK